MSRIQGSSHVRDHSISSTVDGDQFNTKTDDVKSPLLDRNLTIGNPDENKNLKHQQKATSAKANATTSAGIDSDKKMEAECLTMLAQSTKTKGKARAILARVKNPEVKYETRVYYASGKQEDSGLLTVTHNKTSMEDAHRFLTAAQKEKVTSKLQNLLQIKDKKYDFGGVKEHRTEAQAALFNKVVDIFIKDSEVGGNAAKSIEKAMLVKTYGRSQTVDQNQKGVMENYRTNLHLYSEAGLLSCSIEQDEKNGKLLQKIVEHPEKIPESTAVTFKAVKESA